MAASCSCCGAAVFHRPSRSGARLAAATRSAQPKLQRLATSTRQRDIAVGALDIDWSSAETWIGVGGAVAGIAVGIGIPAFYMAIESNDEKRLNELRELNRQTYKETGQYLSEEEINSFRSPRWTDRRQFEDDD